MYTSDCWGAVARAGRLGAEWLEKNNIANLQTIVGRPNKKFEERYNSQFHFLRPIVWQAAASRDRFLP